MYAKVFFPKSESIDQQKPARTADELQKMQNLLNQKRIELIFGNYKVDVLFQENNIRVSNLNSNGVMRTCALVDFVLPVPDWLKATHEKIYAGASIGQAIKEDGFELSKEPVYFGITELPEIARKNMETNENSAAVHIYQLKVSSNPQSSESFLYCTIVELHSPLYLTLGDLRALYPQDTLKYNTVTDSVQQHLNTLSQIDELIPSSSNEHK
ncbi:MAG: hypothetical protein EPN84_06090 [Legionella sp.]|nr:MAG: hypothetical protein EPN84_06090 [Legionella sp.]